MKRILKAAAGLCGAPPSSSPAAAADNDAATLPANNPTSTVSDSAPAEEPADPNLVGINELEVGLPARRSPETTSRSRPPTCHRHGARHHGHAAGLRLDMHFEIDIKTTEKAKEIGFAADQFLPYLKITPKLTENRGGRRARHPHADDRLRRPPLRQQHLAEAWPYTVELTIQSPADDFMLHTGKDTSGVQGRFWNELLKVVFDNFEWDGRLLRRA